MGWSRPSVTGTSPSARCAHTSNLVGSGKLFVFGGWNGSKMLNDLHIYYAESSTWSRPVTTGTVPGIRAGHTMAAVGTKLFVFGGGDGTNYLNDLHIFDTETMTWSQAYVAGLSPAARSRHTMTLVDDKLLIVFGGGDDTRVYNDLYVLDTGTMSWSRPTSRGQVPLARWGHTTTFIGDSKLLVFGGHDGTKMLNDVCVLDVSTMTWTQLAPHQATTDGTAPNSPPSVPSPRAGHTASYAPSVKRVFMFGGGDGTKVLNDSWFLDIATGQWSRPTISGNAPLGRCAHTSTVIEDKICIFGGGDGSRRFKDLCVLDPEQVLNAEDTKKNKTSKKLVVKQRKAEKNETPKDISSWLTSIGMQKYAEKFIAQEIDLDVLPYVTEAHLEQIGVTTVGARIRFLVAIKKTFGHAKEEVYAGNLLHEGGIQEMPNSSDKDWSCEHCGGTLGHPTTRPTSPSQKLALRTSSENLHAPSSPHHSRHEGENGTVKQHIKIET